MGMRRAFTLIEVTLALGLLSVGVLAIIGLYSFGYRETSQSREDVGAAALADAVLGRLSTALSATNMTWSTFKKLKSYPNDNGWGAYLDGNGRVSGDPSSLASTAYGDCMKDLGREDASLPAMGDFSWGLVIIRYGAESRIVGLGFRAVRQKSSLMSAPLFYTEARFQGVSE